MDGKVDWMAHGHPVEGAMGGLVGDALVEVATCGPDERVADVVRRVHDRAVVVSCHGMAVGEVDGERLRDASGDETVLDVMEPVPSTLRPSVGLSNVDERVAGRLVTTPDGILLGAVDPAAVQRSPDGREELRQHLIGHGHTPEEADRILAGRESAPG